MVGDHLTRPNRCYMKSARDLFVTSMFPLTSPSHMILRWQSGEVEGEDTALADSDEEGGDCGPVMYTTNEGDGIPALMHTTIGRYKL